MGEQDRIRTTDNPARGNGDVQSLREGCYSGRKPQIREREEVGTLKAALSDLQIQIQVALLNLNSK